MRTLCAIPLVLTRMLMPRPFTRSAFSTPAAWSAACCPTSSATSSSVRALGTQLTKQGTAEHDDRLPFRHRRAELCVARRRQLNGRLRGLEPRVWPLQVRTERHCVWPETTQRRLRQLARARPLPSTSQRAPALTSQFARNVSEVRRSDCASSLNLKVGVRTGLCFFVVSFAGLVGTPCASAALDPADHAASLATFLPMRCAGRTSPSGPASSPSPAASSSSSRARCKLGARARGRSDALRQKTNAQRMYVIRPCLVRPAH